MPSLRVALLQEMDFTSLKNVRFSKWEVKNKGSGIFVIISENFNILGVPFKIGTSEMIFRRPNFKLGRLK